MLLNINMPKGDIELYFGKCQPILFELKFVHKLSSLDYFYPLAASVALPKCFLKTVHLCSSPPFVPKMCLISE